MTATTTSENDSVNGILESLEEWILLLASNRPDSVSCTKRLEYMEEVYNQLDDVQIGNQGLQLLSTWDDLTCSSKRYGYERILSLYTHGIGLLLQKQQPQETKGGGDDDDNEDNNNNDDDEEILKGLLRNLCRLLTHAQSLNLLFHVEQSLWMKSQSQPTTTTAKTTTETKTETTSSLTETWTLLRLQRIVAILETIAKDVKTQQNSAFAPAISLGYSLSRRIMMMDTGATTTTIEDWYTCFINQAIPQPSSSSTKVFATSDEIELCAPFLSNAFAVVVPSSPSSSSSSSSSSSLLETDFLPLMIRKLKANPENVFHANILHGLITSLQPYIWECNTTDDKVSDQFLSLLGKHLTSSKYCSMVESIFCSHRDERLIIKPQQPQQQLQQLLPEPFLLPPSNCTILCTSILQQKNSLGVQQRQSIYNVFKTLGQNFFQTRLMNNHNNKKTTTSSNNTNTSTQQLLNLSSIDAILEVITCLLSKETSTSTSRQIGLQALVVWILISIRISNSSSITATSTTTTVTTLTDMKFYESSLQILRQPIQKLATTTTNKTSNKGTNKTNKQQQQQLQQTPSISSSALSDCSFVFMTMVQIVPYDLLESFILDLWNGDTTPTSSSSSSSSSSSFYNGLVTIITAQAPVESLLALYIVLIYANAFGGEVTPILLEQQSSQQQQQQQSSQQQQQPKKLLSLHTFLSSTSLLDTVTKHFMMNQVLPRVLQLMIRLEHKQQQQQDEEEPTRTQVGGGGGRLLLSVDSTAKIMACCICHSPPGSSFGSAGGGIVMTTLSTLLSYQSNQVTGPLIHTLWDRVSQLSEQSESIQQSWNATRQAREKDLYHEIMVTSSSTTPTTTSSTTSTTSTTTTSSSSTTAMITNTTNPKLFKGQGFYVCGVHNGMDVNIIRRVSYQLSKIVTSKMIRGQEQQQISSLTKVLILMHVGTTVRNHGRQRNSLMNYTLQVIQEILNNNTAGLEEQENITNGISKQLSSMLFPSSSSSSNSNISGTLHQSIRSLITSLGKIASQFAPETDDPNDEEMIPYVFASKICLSLAKHLDQDVMNSFYKVHALSQSDIDLYQVPMGVLYRYSSNDTNNTNNSTTTTGTTTSTDTNKKKVKTARRKGGMSLEDEEWEEQIKKELAAKKNKGKDGGGNDNTNTNKQPKPLTPEEQKLLKQQDERRKQIRTCIETFVRILQSIQQLFLSDIEIGNQCLPILSNHVLLISSCAFSSCSSYRSNGDNNNNNDIDSGSGSDGSGTQPYYHPAFGSLHKVKDETIQTLQTLTTCIYEIDEMYSSMLAQALLISCRAVITATKNKTATENTGGGGGGDSKDGKDTTTNTEEIVQVDLESIPLPAPCTAAATAIDEMDQFGMLSGNSFASLFPILQAALRGPRTTPGCEAALQVLGTHTALLVRGGGEEDDDEEQSQQAPDPVVTPLRKDMAITVLELLKHDRAQTFMYPNPYEALISCYRTTTTTTTKRAALSTAELAPLLNERGALGSKSCRVASMMALGDIATHHQKMIKNNPLIENRIWLNCFEKNEEIRTEARKTWNIVQNGPINEDGSTTDENLPPPSIMYAVPLLPLLSHGDPSIATSAADAYAYAMGRHSKSVQKNVQKLCSTYIESFPTMDDSGQTTAAGAGADNGMSSLPKPIKPVPKPTTKKKPATLGLPKKKSTTKKSALAIVSGGIGKPKTAKKKAANSALLKPKVERTFDQSVLENQFKTDGTKAKGDISKDSEEKQSIRQGILRVIVALTNANVPMDIGTITLLTSFLMAYGIAEVDETVKGAARNTLRDTVACYGASEEAIAFLLPHLESVLKTGVADEAFLDSLPTDKVPRDVSASDRRKEGAVVALGAMALHLKGPDNEAKIDTTIDMLLSTLKTPSEDVQLSVADCLAKLMKKGKTQQRVETILSDLMQECLYDDSLATRRGAAYGISAVVKGSGIATLKKYDVVKKLEEACSSGGPNSKEGSLFAIELLSVRLGLLFEPYVIVLLPSLLKSFSDSSDHVRKAASHTAGLIMSKLSAHGVKLVMPAVLTAFNDPAWRTKQASIRMLGSMSHLAPKQLASALPKVVPKLTEAFSDTHPKVKSSAQEALDEISTVIRNPEISSISPTLLKALTDPADYTIKALEKLIETEFLHAIDAPSLALVVPILHRGLRDRGATTKRYGALIAGNICTMINDPKDFVPYIPTLLPDLKTVLLDPIPDVRSTSGKALGSLTRGLGEHILPDLRPWLVEMLRDESCSSAERSGAAQGLTEVLIAAGSTVVEDAMITEILPLQNHRSAATREGVLWMLTFLPPSLGQGFTPLMDDSLPALISGLSDDSELVREVAMRAGRVLIRSHGKVHVDKILPPLEAGLTNDEDYRIRLASLSLLGDLLSTIGGTTLIKGDGNTRDDIRRAERAQAQIALTLGNEKRKRVLSGLYLARSDTSSVVRQSAIQVWKTVVSVTARTLREILPVLVGKVVDGLASGSAETTLVAGRCLGDVVTKLGDSVLAEIIPVLRDALYAGDGHTKRGVCVGLSEVIRSSSRDQIIRYLDILVKVVQDALCDDDENVREMAASSFQSLYSVVGSRALDEIVPSLMVALEGDDVAKRDAALNGLTGVIRVRSKDLLPYVVPRLIQRPVSQSHAEALSGIARVTGEAIFHHFNSIIPTLLGELSSLGDNSSDDYDDEEKEREESIRDCSRSMCGYVDEAGVNWLVSEIASKCGSDKVKMRKESCWMLELLIVERKEDQDFYEFIPVMLRELLYRLNDDQTEVVKASHSALLALSKHVPAEELVKHVEFMRNHLASIVSEARRRKGGVGDGEFLLPGFNMPKGLEPLLPIYQRGILYGDPNIREVSASGLGEVITLTSTKYLAGPLIIKMTGPLLRIVGDRNTSNVKIAILRTLGLILVKGGPALRAFVPQFQTTFVKALSDPSRQVRLEAVEALSLLMPLSTRVDPLIKELVAGSLGKSSVVGSETGAVAAVQTATLEALATVLTKAGKKAKLPDSIPSALNASKELLRHDDDGVREAAAKVMGAAVDVLGSDAAKDVINKEVILQEDKDNPATVRHGMACAVRRILASSVGRELDESMEDLKRIVMNLFHDDKGIVKEASCVAIGAVIARASDSSACIRELEPILLNVMKNSRAQMEIHRAVARGLCLCLVLLSDDIHDRVSFMGTSLMAAILNLAMSGSQRVQFAYNDLLWLALDVQNGQAGLDKYSSIAEFENVKAMKSIYSKVLTRIKKLSILDD